MNWDATDFLLCGMPKEVEILSAAFPHNPVHGGDAKTRLPALVPPGCRRIVSCGLGGGLSPKIEIARGAVATIVTDGASVWSCDDKWNMGMLDLAYSPASADSPWARGFQECPWYSSGVMDQGDTAPQRSALLAATGAWGIDDETHAAAVFCKNNGLMLNVLRFCSDDASETLPLAARGAVMNADGSANMSYVMKELVSEGLMQDAMLAVVFADYNNSLSALRACAQALAGPT